MNDTKFTTGLLAQLSDRDNSVISPHGIAAVLAMAAEGAGGNTLKEILDALGADSEEQLRKSVMGFRHCEAFQSKNELTVEKGQDGAQLRDSFRDVLTEAYAATIREENGGPVTALRLKNVATFKAQWAVTMKREPEGRCFHNADGSKCRPAILMCDEELRYYQDDECFYGVQAVALPYRYQGTEIPYELVLLESCEPVTEALLREVLSGMERGSCQVEFPEFAVKSTFGLIPMMQALGVTDLFDPERCVLDGMATLPLYAAAFSQQAEIEVDQHGTVAKAITCMDILCNCSLSIPVQLLFYRPFCYFLRNTLTEEILFIGKVNQVSDLSSGT